MSVEEQLSDERFKSDKHYNEIQKELIKLKHEDIIACNQILKQVIIDEVIERMKKKDQDFADLYEKPMFGGSFYKNLKVGKPNEFDLCLTVNLCKSVDEKLLKITPDDDYPSYVKIRLQRRKIHKNKKFWRKILNEDNYLNQDEFRSWMQEIIDSAFTEYQTKRKGFIIKLGRKHEDYYLEKKQSGPAFTIHLIKINKDPGEDPIEIDFDLVPCLVFRNRKLEGFRTRRCEKWIAIAKPHESDTTWRAGFFNDEKKMIAGQIKPIIRMVKKLRDVEKMTNGDWEHLKSYFIETLFYYNLDRKYNPHFADYYEDYPRTAVFMYMIGQLEQILRSGRLPDYWHKKFNLLRNIEQSQLLGMANKLKNIIDDLDNGKKSLLDIFQIKVK